MLLNVCLNCDYSILYNSGKLLCKNKMSPNYNLKVKHCSFCNWFTVGYPRFNIQCVSCENYDIKLALCSIKRKPSDVWYEADKSDYCSDFKLYKKHVSMLREIRNRSKERC